MKNSQQSQEIDFLFILFIYSFTVISNSKLNITIQKKRYKGFNNNNKKHANEPNNFKILIRDRLVFKNKEKRKEFAFFHSLKMATRGQMVPFLCLSPLDFGCGVK